MERIRITEYLDLDLNDETWYCHCCSHNLISARKNYKEGCLVNDRDPREIHPPIVDGDFNFAPNPKWMRILEFYCPSCGTQIETEYLPPGHPITQDIEIDIDSLKKRLASGEIEIRDGRQVSNA